MIRLKMAQLKLSLLHLYQRKKVFHNHEIKPVFAALNKQDLYMFCY